MSTFGFPEARTGGVSDTAPDSPAPFLKRATSPEDHPVQLGGQALDQRGIAPQRLFIHVHQVPGDKRLVVISRLPEPFMASVPAAQGSVRHDRNPVSGASGLTRQAGRRQISTPASTGEPEPRSASEGARRTWTAFIVERKKSQRAGRRKKRGGINKILTFFPGCFICAENSVPLK